MEDLHRFLKSHPDEPHGYISLPTGVGKTVLFTELVKATDLRTLILMPTRGLLDQTEQAFQRFGEETPVGKVFGGEKNGRERITLSTYASFVRHTKTGSRHIAPGRFNLIILDEAHRALGDETKHALKKYDDAIQVGFTATEDYSEQRRLQSLLPTEIHKMTIKEAVEHNLITPFINTVVKTGVDVSKVKITQTNEYDAADLERALNTDNRNQIALQLYQQHFDGQKTVIFCNGVEHAKAVAEVFEDAGIAAKAMHGKLSLQEQIDTKDAFASDGPYAFSVLTNDKLLTEGFDVPTAAVCFNLAPTLSRVRAQQRGGRVLRLDPQNPDKIAYIVDFIDESYQKPPVLFADPRIGESANIGVTSTELPPGKGIENSELTIITNPEVVTSMAQRFFERHKITREYAPEGWLSMGQIMALYNLSSVTVHASLSEIEQRNTSQARKFHTPFVKGKIQRTYYSPVIIQKLSESQGLPYIDFETTFPDGWVVREQFEIDYTPRVLASLYNYTKRLNTTMWVDQSLTVGDSEYYGPDLQKALERTNKPGKHWVSIEPLMDKYNSDEAEIEEIIRLLARKEKKLNGTYPLWCMVDGREELYTFPLAYEYIENELLDIRDRANKPQPLREGEAVSLRDNAAKMKELARLFARDKAKETKKIVERKQKELDALYAEFM